MSHAADSTACYNCGADLSGPYCAACGQKAQPLNPTVHDLLHDATHEFLHVDGRIFQSVRTLLLQPGVLTREQFLGRRVRWISPIRLYLIFSVLYFAAASLSGGNVRLEMKGSDVETAQEMARLGFASEAEFRETVQHAQKTWLPRVMFVLVPLFALFVQVAARRTPKTYPQHLHFALHVHAAWFFAGTAAALASLTGSGFVEGAVGVLAVVYGLTYIVIAFRTAYGGSIKTAVLRSAAVVAVYWLVTILATLAIILPAIFRHR